MNYKSIGLAIGIFHNQRENPEQIPSISDFRLVSLRGFLYLFTFLLKLRLARKGFCVLFHVFFVVRIGDTNQI
jgi:hypothetical protein